MHEGFLLPDRMLSLSGPAALVTVLWAGTTLCCQLCTPDQALKEEPIVQYLPPALYAHTHSECAANGVLPEQSCCTVSSPRCKKQRQAGRQHANSCRCEQAAFLELEDVPACLLCYRTLALTLPS